MNATQRFSITVATEVFCMIAHQRYRSSFNKAVVLFQKFLVKITTLSVGRTGSSSAVSLFDDFLKLRINILS